MPQKAKEAWFCGDKKQRIRHLGLQIEKEVKHITAGVKIKRTEMLWLLAHLSQPAPPLSPLSSINYTGTAVNMFEKALADTHLLLPLARLPLPAPPLLPPLTLQGQPAGQHPALLPAAAAQLPARPPAQYPPAA